VRSPAELLQDMLDAIERVERYAARGRNAFNTDELIQTWIVHHIEIIGEAATRLDRVSAMRTVERDLPDLKSKTQLLLQRLGEP